MHVSVAKLDTTCWKLAAESSVGIIPSALEGTHVGAGTLGESEKVDFTLAAALGLVDASALYDSLLAHKRARRLDHFYIPRTILPHIRSAATCASPPATEMTRPACMTLPRAPARPYLDRFAARRERERESKEIAPAKLAVKDQLVTFRVRTTPDELFKELQGLVKKGMTELQKTDWKNRYAAFTSSGIFTARFSETRKTKLMPWPTSPSVHRA